MVVLKSPTVGGLYSRGGRLGCHRLSVGNPSGPRGQEAVVVGELRRLRDRDPAEDLLDLQGVHPLQRIGLRAEGTVGKQ